MITLDYSNDEIEKELTNYYNLHIMVEYATVVRKDVGLIVQSLEFKDLKLLTKLLNKLGF